MSYEQYRNEKDRITKKERKSNIEEAVKTYGSRRMDKRSKSKDYTPMTDSEIGLIEATLGYEELTPA